MYFKNRKEAGKLLARKLKKYIDQDIVIYAFPRGGVETAIEVARFLAAPLDLVITRKISHPYDPEYAIAAISESGHIIIGNRREVMKVDEEWFEEAVEKARLEAIRRREKYMKGRSSISPKGKIAILVDDGVATGLTIRAGIHQLKQAKPKKIIVAAPIISKSTAAVIQAEVDVIVALEVPDDKTFLGAIGAYYENFAQVTDEELIDMLKNYENTLGTDVSQVFTVKHRMGETYFIDKQ